MSAALARPLGFLLLMLGFGLRLDTSWQILAWLLLAVGAAVSALGLFGPESPAAASASVPPADGE